MNWRGARFNIDSLVTMAIGVTCVVLVWTSLSSRNERSRSDPRPPTEPQSIEGAAIIGDRTAQVAVIEYSEFQCPFCGAFARDAWPAIHDRYVASGKVLFAFRQLPIESIHPSAFRAAETVVCASRQGRFEEMRSLLFEGQTQLPRVLAEAANRVSLDVEAFGQCMGGQAREAVEADLQSAKALRLTATPTFLLGRFDDRGRVRVSKVIIGARPLRTFETALDSLLRETQ